MKSVLNIALFLLIGGYSTDSLAANSGMTLRNRIQISKKSYFSRAPRIDSRELNLKKMNLINKKRQALIEDIKRFLRDARDKEQKIELSMRLGSLFMEDYYAELQKAQVLFEKRSKAYEAKKIKTKPVFDNSKAMASLDRSRTIYKELLKESSNSERFHEILYFLAASSMDMGNTNEALGYYKQLVEKFPNSKYVEDALIELGDHQFNNNQYQAANDFYNQLLNRKSVSLMSYAYYKKAWCEYNLGDKPTSLKYFQWVILNEDKLEAKPGEREVVHVKAEALRDITLPFVDLKIVRPAIEFLKDNGGSQFRPSLEMMASLFYEGGDYENSIVIRETLLEIDKNYPKNPEYEIPIVEAYRLLGKEGVAITRLFNALPTYMPKSHWHQLNATNPEVISTAINLFEEKARNYAFQFHAEAQKTQSTDRYEWSKKLYFKYIEYFPNTPHTSKIRFYLAEILYRENDFINAAHHYYLVYKDPNAGSLKLDSIRFALSALDQQLNNDRKKQGLTEISSKTTLKIGREQEEKFTEYSTTETKFLAIAEEYLKFYSKNPDAPDVHYESAYLQYVHHDFLKSYQNFWAFIKNYATHKAAVPAAYLVLDILNRKENYPVLVQACKSFLNNKPLLKDPKFGPEVAKILRAAELQIIAGYEKKGEYRKAALAYVEYTKEYGPQDLALYETALYNATVNFTKAESYLEAVTTQEQFLRRFRNSPLRENMLLAVAKTYELFAGFSKAAGYFQQFSEEYPKNEQAKNALRLAGLYYWGAGKVNEAEALMFRNLKLSQSEAEQELIKKDLMDLYETEGQTNKLIGFYNNELNSAGSNMTKYFSIALRLAEIKAANNHRDTGAFIAKLVYNAKANAGVLARTSEGKDALAKLLLWDLRNQEEVFYNIRLELPESVLVANLQKKLALLENLQNQYTQIAGLGAGGYSLGALYKSANLYRHISQSVFQAPVPGSLSAEQLDVYRDELKKTYIDPFNDKALKMAEQCVDKSQELQILSVWASHCYTLAATYQPKRYPRVRTFYLPALNIAFMFPDKQKTEVDPKGVGNYELPLYSSYLFESPGKNREIAALNREHLWIDDSSIDLSESIAPTLVTYSTLAAKREAALKQALASLTPSTAEKVSLGYLNLATLVDARKIQPILMSSIEANPKDDSLKNLLALNFLEQGNLGAAKVTLLSLIARGQKSSVVMNNLGVLALRQGKEDLARELYQEAFESLDKRDKNSIEGAQTAARNLGFMSLQYRAGFKAKQYFKTAIDLDPKDASSRVGYISAQIQNRELEGIRNELVSATKNYRNNPLARFALGYYLMDVTKEYRLAKQVFLDYIRQFSADKDYQFRRALSEAKHDTAGDGLPTIQ